MVDSIGHNGNDTQCVVVENDRKTDSFWIFWRYFGWGTSVDSAHYFGKYQAICIIPLFEVVSYGTVCCTAQSATLGADNPKN